MELFWYKTADMIVVLLTILTFLYYHVSIEVSLT